MLVSVETTGSKLWVKNVSSLGISALLLLASAFVGAHTP